MEGTAGSINVVDIIMLQAFRGKMKIISEDSLIYEGDDETDARPLPNARSQRITNTLIITKMKSVVLDCSDEPLLIQLCALRRLSDVCGSTLL